MTDHRTIPWAVEIIGMCEPIRCHQGGFWFGRNNNFADATFVDYGAADAFAVAAKALPGLVKALDDLNIHAVEVGSNMMIPKVEWDAALAPFHAAVSGDTP